MRTCTARMTEDIIPKVPPAAPDSPEHPKLLDLPKGKMFCFYINFLLPTFRYDERGTGYKPGTAVSAAWRATN